MTFDALSQVFSQFVVSIVVDSETQFYFVNAIWNLIHFIPTFCSHLLMHIQPFIGNEEIKPEFEKQFMQKMQFF